MKLWRRKYKTSLVDNQPFYFRILDYMKSKRDQILIDPTPERQYLRAKASRLNISIVEKQMDITLNDDSNWKRLFMINDGWSKILENYRQL